MMILPSLAGWQPGHPPSSCPAGHPSPSREKARAYFLGTEQAEGYVVSWINPVLADSPLSPLPASMQYLT